MKQVYPTTIQSGMSQSGSCVLMLLEPEGGRQVPIIIGRNEAQAILLALNPEEGSKVRRPLTHNLMVDMMHTYGLTLKSVTIDRVLEGIFYATLHITDGFNEHTFDSRTTDAITLALLSEAPVYMDEQVIADTGVVVNQTETSHPASLEELEEELRRCEESEDYERAAEIQKRIEALKTT